MPGSRLETWLVGSRNFVVPHGAKWLLNGQPLLTDSGSGNIEVSIKKHVFHR